MASLSPTFDRMSEPGLSWAPVRYARTAGLRRPIDHAWADFWLHASGITIVAVIRMADDSGLLTLSLGGIVCCFVYGFLALRESRTADHRVTLLSWLFAMSVLNSGFSAIYLAVYLAENGYLPFVTIALGPPSLASGYLIFLIGQVFFHLGYLVRARKKLLFQRYLIATAGRTPGRIAPVIFFWILGIVATLFPEISKGFLGSIGGTFERAQLASLAYLALRGPENFHIRRQSWWTFLIVGSAGNFLVSLTQNSKTLILLSLLPLFWYFMKTSWRSFTVSVLSALTLYAFVVHPVVTIARERNESEGIAYAKFLFDTFERSGGIAGMMEKSGGPLQSAHDMLMRPFQATIIGFIFEETDRAGFRYGETLEGSWFAFIPRVFWHDKPTVTRGGVWREYISGAAGGGGIALSAQGEMYWNWGLLGVSAGMLLIGALYGELVKLAGDPLGSQIRMLLHLNLVLAVGELTDVLSTVVGLVAAFGLFAVLIPVSERVVARRKEIASLFASRRPVLRPPLELPAGTTSVVIERPVRGESAELSALLAAVRRRELEQLVSSGESRRRDLVESLAAVAVLATRSRASLESTWERTGAGSRFGLAQFPKSEMPSLLQWLGKRREAIASRVQRRHLGEAGYSAGKTTGFVVSASTLSGIALDSVLDSEGTPLVTTAVPVTPLERLARVRRGVETSRSLGFEKSILVGFRSARSVGFIAPLPRAEKIALLEKNGRTQIGLEPMDIADFRGKPKRFVLFRDPSSRDGTCLEGRLYLAEKSVRTLERKFRGRNSDRERAVLGEKVRRTLLRLNVASVLSVTADLGGLALDRDLDAMAFEIGLEETVAVETSESSAMLSAQDVARACRMERASQRLGTELSKLLPPTEEDALARDGLAALLLVTLHAFRWTEPGLH